MTVNGLVIIDTDPLVLPFYRRELRRGPGAFVETAHGFADFAEAMTQKLYREINDIVVGSLSDTGSEDQG